MMIWDSDCSTKHPVVLLTSISSKYQTLNPQQTAYMPKPDAVRQLREFEFICHGH